MAIIVYEYFQVLRGDIFAKIQQNMQRLIYLWYYAV